ncbi:MAG: DUF433 domain-containing protein [Xanthomonadaceae bacterium]|nr:DUF433 domain-containing protein [Xanthomonadaceae bacterium]MDP2185275.1 DUF433 domain-containing protein [Xanthomonadales bacterium]MDZ4114598.1 DUF433 domain-containing protein [Xanthomonadaceae bacterium]
MNWRDHIVSDPAILVGKPTIKGTRISVELLLDRLADGWSIEDLLESYPHITHDDIHAALAFVSEIFKEESFVAMDWARL